MNKTVFLDMDGTLYNFKGANEYHGSSLSKQVRINLEEFLLSYGVRDIDQFINEAKAREIGYSTLSVEKFNVSYDEYYNAVWNINPKNHIVEIPNIVEIIKNIEANSSKLYLLSDAPRIWINNVLTQLEIIDLFDDIYSGIGEVNKQTGLLYEKIPLEIRQNAIMVGDQEDTDIIMANKYGMETIFISKESRSDYADYTIQELRDILDLFCNN